MNDTAPNVIVIPAKVETPQEQAKKRHLRVAAYCRVSTDSEEQLSSYGNRSCRYYRQKALRERAAALPPFPLRLSVQENISPLWNR